MLKLKKKYKHVIGDVLFVVLIGIFLYSTYKFVHIWYQEGKAENGFTQLVREVTNTPSKDDTYNDKIDNFTVDFKKLKSINSDVVGWIRIPETKVNYPILQGVNNSYYLEKNIEKKYSIAGSIFMNYLNNKDFSDNNTILYGHNMHNGSLFGSLKDIYEKKLGDKVDIYIYTEDGETIYHVYSAYVTDPNDDEPSKIETKNFLRSDVKFDYENTGLETITLSTCYKNSSHRLIIHAMKSEKEEVVKD